MSRRPFDRDATLVRMLEGVPAEGCRLSVMLLALNLGCRKESALALLEECISSEVLVRRPDGTLGRGPNWGRPVAHEASGRGGV